MTEPLTTITLLKQIKDNLPLIQSGWAKVTESNERHAGERLILFMEGKRIFDFGAFEMPYACYKSAENIMAEVEKERAKLPNDAFRTALLELIKVCNRFKSSLDVMNLSERKQYDGQLEEREREGFLKALQLFRYEMGAEIAAMAEAWHIAVPNKLIPDDLMRSLFPQLKTRD